MCEMYVFWHMYAALYMFYITINTVIRLYMHIERMASSLHLAFAVTPEADKLLAWAAYFRINFSDSRLYEHKNQFEPSAWRLHLFSYSANCAGRLKERHIPD